MTRRKLRLGDPYGNRTRVSAVEPKSRLKSNSPALPTHGFAVLEINRLGGTGQNAHAFEAFARRAVAA